MTTTRSLAALLAALCWASVGLAQDPPKEGAEKKDAALERLLEKIDPKADDAKADEKKADEKKAGEKPAEGAKADDSKPAGEDEAKKSGEPEDKALDSLLEKIGERDDAPPPPRRSAAPSPPKDDKEKPEPGKLTGESGKLDEHLEEILGRKKKPKDQRQQPQVQGGGKLGEAIDKMDEVTKRLSETDTGEQTRKKQGEIVKDLETILKQLRQQAGSGRGRMSRAVRQAGNQNGQQPGQEPGNNAGGAPPMPPRNPPDIHAIVGDKSEWGHLPPELRTELDNIFKEEMLQSQRELIERYFLSIKKDRDRKE